MCLPEKRPFRACCYCCGVSLPVVPSLDHELVRQIHALAIDGANVHKMANYVGVYQTWVDAAQCAERDIQLLGLTQKRLEALNQRILVAERFHSELRAMLSRVRMEQADPVLEAVRLTGHISLVLG